MSFTPIIDVAIGLIFVYLLLGLITTALQEIVKSTWNSRGKILQEAVADLVAGGDKTQALFVGVFGHPLMTTTTARKLPSYIPSRTFAVALIDALTKGGTLPAFSQVETSLAALPPGATRDALTALVRDAAGDLDTFKLSVATWFDDAMDRVSGAYKRKAQWFAFGVGLALAVVLNVDSINLANRLWQDQDLRNRVVTSAEAYQDAHTQAAPAATPPAAPPAPVSGSPTGGAADGSAPPPADEGVAARQSLQTDVSALNALSLPIGWQRRYQCPAISAMGGKRAIAASYADNSLVCPGAAKVATTPAPGSVKFFMATLEDDLWQFGFGGFLVALFGWMFTGIAVSLGAPFWFDLLQNVLNLRGAGPKPARADATGDSK